MRKQRGFTLIELMIVISLILILISVAVPNYQRSISLAREAVLRENLYHLRNSIDQYTLDKQRAPLALEDLVSAGYLREIPVDPITNTRDWNVIQEDSLMSVDQTQPGINDVKSTSDAIGSDGRAYSEW